MTPDTKTPGQLLYEHESPPFIAMIPFEGRHFAKAHDIVMVPNERHIPWRFLTAESRSSWERSAVGHHLFSTPVR